MDTLTQPTSWLAQWGHPQLARMDRIEENGADRYLSPYNLNVGDHLVGESPRRPQCQPCFQLTS